MVNISTENVLAEQNVFLKGALLLLHASLLLSVAVATCSSVVLVPLADGVLCVYVCMCVCVCVAGYVCLRVGRAQATA